MYLIFKESCVIQAKCHKLYFDNRTAVAYSCIFTHSKPLKPAFHATRSFAVSLFYFVC